VRRDLIVSNSHANLPGRGLIAERTATAMPGRMIAPDECRALLGRSLTSPRTSAPTGDISPKCPGCRFAAERRDESRAWQRDNLQAPEQMDVSRRNLARIGGTWISATETPMAISSAPPG
jgi:hypothetical protein